MRTGPLAFIATLSIATAGCSSVAQEEPPQPTAVRIAAAFDGPAAPAIRTSGILANQDEVRLSFKVGGVIKRLAVSEGERVRKGQKLAEIEQAEIDAQVEQARQAQEKAQRDLQRGERLYADQVISLEQLEHLRTQTAISQASLAAAQFNWTHAVVVAPHEGTVLRRLVAERELISAGSPVFVLGTEDRGFIVRVGLADREIVQVHLGDAATIRLDALPGVTLAGKITEVASAADPGSGMFNAEISLDAVDQPLKSGLVAKLTITPATARSGSRVYVPIGSIVEGNGSWASVYVLNGDRAQRRAVEVAFIEGETVALARGIATGEQVITDGALYLQDGEHVSVQPPVEQHPNAISKI
jgi:RND family efflux transporter MFP subunit